jgi:hypothetical protein
LERRVPNQNDDAANKKSPVSNLERRIPNQHRRVSNKKIAGPSQENCHAGKKLLTRISRIDAD